MKIVAYATFSAMILACSAHKEVPVNEPKTPPDNMRAKYAEVVERLPRFLDRGFVDSIFEGQNQHQGDSLLFSGLALYALDCQSGQPIADAFAKMMEERDGGVYRHPDLPDKEASLDGLLGLYRGITKRINQCGETGLWARVMKNHRARMAASLPAEFNLVSDTLSYRLGLSDKPDPRRLGLLSKEVASWATLVKRARGACYRIHLGLISLQTLDALGTPISDEDRGLFAEATKDTDMPAVDEYGGRPALEEFLQNFEYNRWQYRHQRCSIWETNDGYGMEHPAIDFLVGYADLYGSPN